MRPHVLGALRLLVLPTIAFVTVVALVPGRAGLAARVYALLLCGTALVLALVALRRAFPAEHSLRDVRRATRTRRTPPASLARIEHEAALGVAGSFDLHFLLVPRLRAIAAGLLESHRRISLTRQPDAAKDVVGEATWPLVRPDRSPPDDRLARGISPDELGRVVDSLEEV